MVGVKSVTLTEMFAQGITVGDEVQVSYKEDGTLSLVVAKVRYVGPCTTVLVEPRISEIYTEGQRLEADTNPRTQDILRSIQQDKAEFPLRPVRWGPPSFKTPLNNLIQTIQLALVQVENEQGPSFWYLFKRCDPGGIAEAFEEGNPAGMFCLRELPRKTNGAWNEADIHFHMYCSVLEDAYPGMVTTLTNWILYGSLATAIRDFARIENILQSPYVNRGDLIPYLQDQYQKDFANLQKLAQPLREDIRVYRGSFEYNNTTHPPSIKSSTLLATTNHPDIPLFFVENYKQIKQFDIPKGYPVVDLREFNPREREILLLPPLEFIGKVKGKSNPESVTDTNLYIIRVNAAPMGGGRKKQKTRRSKKSKR